MEKVHEIQLTKNKMDRNIRKMTNHPPSPRGSELASRYQRVSRWFGHVGRMAEHRMARTEVNGGWVRGRTRLGWMDDVKVALGNRGMTVGCAKELRALGHM